MVGAAPSSVFVVCRGEDEVVDIEGTMNPDAKEETKRRQIAKDDLILTFYE